MSGASLGASLWELTPHTLGRDGSDPNHEATSVVKQELCLRVFCGEQVGAWRDRVLGGWVVRTALHPRVQRSLTV